MPSVHLKRPTKPAYPLNVMDGNHALRAIIFDCDGVLIDSEPLHFAAFKKTLGDGGEAMSEELYNERYLPLDDRGAIAKFYTESGRPLSAEGLSELCQKKTEIYQDMIKTEGVLAYPAVPELVMALAQRYPLAVASGSRRHELELVLEAAGIRSYFEVVVSADDVKEGKPDPESYLRAVEELNRTGKRTTPIHPEECLVIEDSRDGVRSAHTARMKCIAVATSYPAFELSIADLVVPSLAALRVSQIEDLFQPTPQPAPSPQTN